MKITMPSPLTVGDTIVDDHYGDLNALGGCPRMQIFAIFKK